MAGKKAKAKKKPSTTKEFDPEGSGYDYKSARAAGLAPDKTGHWPSRVPKNGLLLKGRKHKTWPLTVAEEARLGYSVFKYSGRYFSNRPASMFEVR